VLARRAGGGALTATLLVGSLQYQGFDGTNYLNCASIEAFVDGTPGTNDMPGRLVFSTTADGSSTPTERLRIDSDGNVGVGTTSPVEKLDIGNGIIRVANQVTPVNESDGAFYAGKIGGIGAISNQAGIALRVAGSEKVRITSAGNVGIGTTDPDSSLHLSSTNPRITLTDTDTGADHRINASSSVGNFAIDVDVNSETASPSLVCNIKGGEKARIDSSGRLLVGTASARVKFDNATGSALIQAEGTNGYQSGISVVSNRVSTSNNFPAYLRLARSGATTVGSNTIVADGNVLGRIDFSGADGTEFVNSSAITAEVDGTPGANDMPGRLVFSTTADGSSSPTERMRIANDGRIILPTGSPGIAFDGNDTSGAGVDSKSLDDYEEGTFTPALASATAYTVANGQYTRIGDVVYFTIRIQASAATPTGANLVISGLPYTSQNVTATSYGGAFNSFGSLVSKSTRPNLNLHIPLNNTEIRFYDGTSLLSDNSSGVSLTQNVILQGFYFAV